jgi:hypothetical protein
MYECWPVSVACLLLVSLPPGKESMTKTSPNEKKVEREDKGTGILSYCVLVWVQDCAFNPIVDRKMMYLVVCNYS